MSKEMAIIVLGILVILVRTMLGIPGNWQTAIFIVAGALIAILGFLLRGEAISRRSHTPARSRHDTYSFVESDPESAHEHKEGITSLN
jgi:hypothetical protein